MKEELLKLVEELEELASINRNDIVYSELGDWFYSWGSSEVNNIAAKLKSMANKLD